MTRIRRFRIVFARAPAVRNRRVLTTGAAAVSACVAIEGRCHQPGREAVLQQRHGGTRFR